MKQQPVVVIPAYQPDSKLTWLVTQLHHLRSDCRILIVNDGSTRPESLQVIQGLERLAGVTVLHHAVNLGKGQALKTAMNYFLLHLSQSCVGIVTADADGQHRPEDILRLGTLLDHQPEKLWLGVRSFSGAVPLRSQVGNVLTRQVFRLFAGVNVADTQTGLRGIPVALLPRLLRIRSTGYDFELEMLMLASRNGFSIASETIATIYENNNKGSHFNPLFDSLKIYFVFLRFSALSLLAAVLDNALFAIFFALSHEIIYSLIGARVIAGVFNFISNRRVVFHSRGELATEAMRYTALAVAMLTLSTVLVFAMTSTFHTNVIVSKILVESVLFVLSFSIQNSVIFRSRKTIENFPPPSSAVSQSLALEPPLSGEEEILRP